VAAKWRKEKSCREKRVSVGKGEEESRNFMGRERGGGKKRGAE